MTAIRLRHRGIVYRLLRFAQTADWSLVIAWDRHSLDEPESHRFTSAEKVPERVTSPTDPKRLTYHTSGQVNYHGWVQCPLRYHAPLQALVGPELLIGVSVAEIGGLTPLGTGTKKNDTVIELADDVGDTRFTFGLLAAPLTFDSPPNLIFRLDYDVFSIVCVSIPPPEIPIGLERHNIYFAPEGPLRSRAIQNLDSAMLAYHQARIGNSGLGIYPPNGEGVYHLLPSVVMRAIPSVKIAFVDPDYRIEIIEERARPMLIPFHIFRGTERITRGDLRSMIVGVELSAELIE